jgi:hypothetical protein
LLLLVIGIFFSKGLDSIFENPKILPDGQISGNGGSRTRRCRRASALIIGTEQPTGFLIFNVPLSTFANEFVLVMHDKPRRRHWEWPCRRRAFATKNQGICIRRGVIFVQDVDDNISYVVRADRANAVVLGKLPDLGMPIERRISRPLPHAILCEYAYKSIDIVKVYRVAVDLYQPRTLVLNL